VLTRTSFDRLLSSLDPDREHAGERYELVRRKLVKFFECRGSLAPEDDADEAIGRVARRIEEGERVEHLTAYFYGVARMVLLESRRRPERLPLPAEPAAPEAATDAAAEARLACLETCLDRLPPDQRELVVGYYQGDSGERIRLRRALAGRCRIPMNALRIRVHRLRQVLEACVLSCVTRSAR
jgi:DNA-directed RNA polymerase specialized sigma24 family protein